MKMRHKSSSSMYVWYHTIQYLNIFISIYIILYNIIIMILIQWYYTILYRISLHQLLCCPLWESCQDRHPHQISCCLGWVFPFCTLFAYLCIVLLLSCEEKNASWFQTCCRNPLVCQRQMPESAITAKLGKTKTSRSLAYRRHDAAQ